ncbi:MAG TPA: ribulose-phosphate 3-epimerase, partial [Terricaulis sp.]|nr:ribulose-phosphate 3-epimerase [Terricaulis sp.]
QAIRATGSKAGVSLNPGTPADVIDPIIDLLDLVLVMSVNPGFGGQSFIESVLPKIRAVRKKIDASGRDIILEVDGGVNAKTAPAVIEAGATALVAGTAVYGGDASAYAENIARLRNPH